MCSWLYFLIIGVTSLLSRNFLNLRELQQGKTRMEKKRSCFALTPSVADVNVSQSFSLKDAIMEWLFPFLTSSQFHRPQVTV
jgi:hypothetical protein